jgi:acyl-CoA synthetase (AMP-forming)/AMP-acid ligase II
LEYVAAFLGTLAAGAVAVPAYPPLSKRVVERVSGIISDCKPAVVLADGSYPRSLAEKLNLAGAAWINGEEVIDRGVEVSPPESDALALLQYTSGSTGAPKGVMLSHANLVANCEAIGAWLGEDPNRKGCIWLPPYHDMGLLGGILQPIYEGFPLVLLTPLHFLQEPFRWLRAISTHRVTLSGAPNFAYDLCAKSKESIEGLDLSCWTEAFCGAEPVRPNTLQRFVERFRPSGFRPESFLPCYGMAEATLLISGRSPGSGTSLVRTYARRSETTSAPHTRPSTVDLCPCGVSVPGTEVRIVDTDSLLEVGAGQCGEIWVAGPTVARGYYGKKEASAQTFGGRLPGSELNYLRTGDVGFVDEGELVVTGRLKDLIVIAGKNHHPEDIERTAQEAHSGIFPSGVAAFSIEDEDEETLILAAEAEFSHEPEVIEQVTQSVLEAVTRIHGISPRVVLVCRRGALSRTSSGKVQRKATRDAYLEGRLGRRRATVPQPPVQLSAGAEL